jgi:hypothetical protein
VVWHRPRSAGSSATTASASFQLWTAEAGDFPVGGRSRAHDSVRLGGRVDRLGGFEGSLSWSAVHGPCPAFPVLARQAESTVMRRHDHPGWVEQSGLAVGPAIGARMRSRTCSPRRCAALCPASRRRSSTRTSFAASCQARENSLSTSESTRRRKRSYGPRRGRGADESGRRSPSRLSRLIAHRSTSVAQRVETLHLVSVEENGACPARPLPGQARGAILPKSMSSRWIASAVRGRHGRAFARQGFVPLLLSPDGGPNVRVQRHRRRSDGACRVAPPRVHQADPRPSADP